MSSHFSMLCPTCGHALRVRHEYVGKSAACKQCGARFVIKPPETTEADALRGEVERLTRRNAELERAAAAEADLSARLARETAALRGELDDLRRDHADASQETSARLAAQREVALAEQETLRQDHANALAATEARAAAEAEPLRAQIDALHRDHADALAALESQRLETEQETARLRAEVDSLARERDAAVAAREADRVRFEATLAPLRAALAALKAKAESERVTYEEIVAASRREGDDAAERARSLQAELNDLRNGLRERDDGLAAAAAEIDRLRAGAEAHASIVEGWEAQLARAHADLQNALDRNQDLEDQLSPLVASAPDAPDVERLNETLSRQSDEMAELRGRLAESDAIASLARDHLLGLGIRLPK